MVEYMVIVAVVDNVHGVSQFEQRLNELAKDDWAVVCSVGCNMLILERITEADEDEDALAETEKWLKETLANQFTFSHSIDDPNSAQS